MAITINFDKLPAPSPLTGSEKQIAWAEQIRTTALEQVRIFITEQLAQQDKVTPEAALAYAKQNSHLYQILLRKTSAAWWIDRKWETSGVGWLSQAAK